MSIFQKVDILLGPMKLITVKAVLTLVAMNLDLSETNGLKIASIPEMKDFCHFETFNASCGNEAVILMQTAQYGRMRFGRCVDRDYGYVGCSANVLTEADIRCSGKRRCSIPVPDSTMQKQQPCPKDLSAYLETSYTCLQVITPPLTTCLSSPTVLTSPSGSIASITTAESGYGSDSCPWVIQADPGQRINLTLLDFSSLEVRQSNQGLQYCSAYAIVRERDGGRSTTVCGGSQRERPIYLSRGHAVEVRIIHTQNRDKGKYFVINYEVTGCKFLRSTQGYTVKHEGERLKLTCNSTGESSYLTCKDNQWVGDFKNCSSANWGIVNVIGNFTSLPVEMTLALVGSVAFIVIVVILVIGLICIRRRRIRQQQEALRENPLLGTKNPYLVAKEKEYVSTRVGKHRSYGDYACIWDSQYPMTLQAGSHDTEGIYPMGYRPVTSSEVVRYSESGPDYDQRGPRMEHIYESPKFVRNSSMQSSSGDLPMYFEIDPTGPPPRNQPGGNHIRMQNRCT